MRGPASRHEQDLIVLCTRPRRQRRPRNTRARPSVPGPKINARDAPTSTRPRASPRARHLAIITIVVESHTKSERLKVKRRLLGCMGRLRWECRHTAKHAWDSTAEVARCAVGHEDAVAASIDDIGHPIWTVLATRRRRARQRERIALRAERWRACTTTVSSHMTKRRNTRVDRCELPLLVLRERRNRMSELSIRRAERCAREHHWRRIIRRRRLGLRWVCCKRGRRAGCRPMRSESGLRCEPLQARRSARLARVVVITMAQLERLKRRRGNARNRPCSRSGEGVDAQPARVLLVALVRGRVW